MLEKKSFMHLRHVTKGKLKETTGRLVGSPRLEERGAMELRASSWRQRAAKLKRTLKKI